MNANFAEETKVLGAIAPASYNSAQDTGWLPIAGFERVATIISVGAIAATGTLNAKLRVAKSAAGASAADLTGKAITQLGADDDDVTLLIEARADEMSDYTHIQLVVTPATAASIVGATVLGVKPHYAPTSNGYDEAVS